MKGAGVMARQKTWQSDIVPSGCAHNNEETA